MRRLLAGLALVLVLAGPSAAGDASLADLLDEATAASAEGDLAGLNRLSAAAVARMRALSDPAPEQAAAALNLRGLALAAAGADPDAATRHFQEAMRVLDDAGGAPDATWFEAAGNLATLYVRRGEADAARAVALRAVRAGRRTEWQGRAAGLASWVHFELGDYPEASLYLRELLSVEPALLAPRYAEAFAAYAEAQDAADAAGHGADALALLEGRVAIVETYAPPGAGEMLQTLWLQAFRLHHQRKEWGAAADALRAAATAAPFPPETAAWVDEMAALTLRSAELSGYAERRSVQLDYTQLAVAFAEIAGPPDDPRLGHALRARAAAEAGLGRLEAAASSLQRAAEVLSRTPEGRAELHLVIADLAGNAWQRGAYDLAEELYQRADRLHAEAVAAGAAPLGRIDRVIGAVNRAQLALDAGRPRAALERLAEAEALFAADAAAGAQKWNVRFEGARIAATKAIVLAALDRPDQATQQSRRAVRLARAALPAGHPDLALTLTNAADLLGSLGRGAAAQGLAREAVAIYDDALPPAMPDAVEARVKLATFALMTGDRATAEAELRRIAEARKSPAYREALPGAAVDFEMLAWLLLSRAEAPGNGRVDEAFRALQWTQVTRSAEALALMEARLMQDDAQLAPLLRRRQDLVETHRRLSSRLLAAFARPGRERAARTLAAEVRQTEDALVSLDGELSRLGLETAGLGGVTPLSLAEVQGLLKPGEALVTFLLPGLRPDRIAGLEGSSNRAIAVTPDRVVVATIPEVSRGRLNRRIAALRCEVAVNDSGCARGGAAALRGAMLAEAPGDSTAGFDFEVARGLYADLFGGLEGVLADRDHLILVPPADLLELPFQVLVTGTGAPAGLAEAPWLIRRHALSVLPSVASLRTLRSRRPARGGGLLGIGDPLIGTGGASDCGGVETAVLRSAPAALPRLTGDSALPLADPKLIAALPRLADTACELQAIGRTLKRDRETLLLREAAREGALKELDAAGRLSGYDVIVFATHGLVSGEAAAAAPGLVLTPPEVATAEDDGLLTAPEIAALRLDADFVVLSACNTAAGESGDADGLSGLARAFFHAGAGGVMVTQWSVYSEAAVRVSTGLFGIGEAEPDVPRSEALRRAMLAILDDETATPFQRHPSYWGAFLLIGAD